MSKDKGTPNPTQLCLAARRGVCLNKGDELYGSFSSAEETKIIVVIY